MPTTENLVYRDILRIISELEGKYMVWEKSHYIKKCRIGLTFSLCYLFHLFWPYVGVFPSNLIFHSIYITLLRIKSEIERKSTYPRMHCCVQYINSHRNDKIFFCNFVVQCTISLFFNASFVCSKM
jgi:hypothetical protein